MAWPRCFALIASRLFRRSSISVASSTAGFSVACNSPTSFWTIFPLKPDDQLTNYSASGRHTQLGIHLRSIQPFRCTASGHAWFQPFALKMQWQLGKVPDRSLTVLAKAFDGFPHTLFGRGLASRVRAFDFLGHSPRLEHGQTLWTLNTETDFVV